MIHFEAIQMWIKQELLHYDREGVGGHCYIFLDFIRKQNKKKHL